MFLFQNTITKGTGKQTETGKDLQITITRQDGSTQKFSNLSDAQKSFRDNYKQGDVLAIFDKKAMSMNMITEANQELFFAKDYRFKETFVGEQEGHTGIVIKNADFQFSSAVKTLQFLPPDPDPTWHTIGLTIGPQSTFNVNENTGFQQGFEQIFPCDFSQQPGMEHVKYVRYRKFFLTDTPPFDSKDPWKTLDHVYPFLQSQGETAEGMNGTLLSASSWHPTTKWLITTAKYLDDDFNVVAEPNRGSLVIVGMADREVWPSNTPEALRYGHSFGMPSKIYDIENPDKFKMEVQCTTSGYFHADNLRLKLDRPAIIIKSVEEPLPTITKTDSFYPNPTSSIANYDYDAKTISPIHIKIVNVLGQTMLEQDVVPERVGINKISIDVSQFASGAYFATLTQDGQTITKKIALVK